MFEGSAWGRSWGDAWGSSWGTYRSYEDAWGDSWGCSWNAAWGHQGCPIPPTPQVIGGGWFTPAYDNLDYKAIEKDDRDFINILIMVIHGIDKRL
jgi:hypothetical protein